MGDDCVSFRNTLFEKGKWKMRIDNWKLQNLYILLQPFTEI